jgi:hypothetical protein
MTTMGDPTGAGAEASGGVGRFTSGAGMMIGRREKDAIFLAWQREFAFASCGSHRSSMFLRAGPNAAGRHQSQPLQRP